MARAPQRLRLPRQVDFGTQGARNDELRTANDPLAVQTSFLALDDRLQLLDTERLERWQDLRGNKRVVIGNCDLRQRDRGDAESPSLSPAERGPRCVVGGSNRAPPPRRSVTKVLRDENLMLRYSVITAIALNTAAAMSASSICWPVQRQGVQLPPLRIQTRSGSSRAPVTGPFGMRKRRTGA